MFNLFSSRRVDTSDPTSNNAGILTKFTEEIINEISYKIGEISTQENVIQEQIDKIKAEREQIVGINGENIDSLDLDALIELNNLNNSQGDLSESREAIQGLKIRLGLLQDEAAIAYSNLTATHEASASVTEIYEEIKVFDEAGLRFIRNKILVLNKEDPILRNNDVSDILFEAIVDQAIRNEAFKIDLPRPGLSDEQIEQIQNAKQLINNLQPAYIQEFAEIKAELAKGKTFSTDILDRLKVKRDSITKAKITVEAGYIGDRQSFTSHLNLLNVQLKHLIVSTGNDIKTQGLRSILFEKLPTINRISSAKELEEVMKILEVRNPHTLIFTQEEIMRFLVSDSNLDLSKMQQMLELENGQTVNLKCKVRINGQEEDGITYDGLLYLLEGLNIDIGDSGTNQRRQRASTKSISVNPGQSKPKATITLFDDSGYDLRSALLQAQSSERQVIENQRTQLTVTGKYSRIIAADIQPFERNRYQESIPSVSNIIAAYSSDILLSKKKLSPLRLVQEMGLAEGSDYTTQGREIILTEKGLYSIILSDKINQRTFLVNVMGSDFDIQREYSAEDVYRKLVYNNRPPHYRPFPSHQAMSELIAIDTDMAQSGYLIGDQTTNGFRIAQNILEEPDLSNKQQRFKAISIVNSGRRVIREWLTETNQPTAVAALEQVKGYYQATLSQFRDNHDVPQDSEQIQALQKIIDNFDSAVNAVRQLDANSGSPTSLDDYIQRVLLEGTFDYRAPQLSRIEHLLHVSPGTINEHTLMRALESSENLTGGYRIDNRSGKLVVHRQIIEQMIEKLGQQYDPAKGTETDDQVYTQKLRKILAGCEFTAEKRKGGGGKKSVTKGGVMAVNPANPYDEEFVDLDDSDSDSDSDGNDTGTEYPSADTTHLSSFTAYLLSILTDPTESVATKVEAISELQSQIHKIGDVVDTTIEILFKKIMDQYLIVKDIPGIANIERQKKATITLINEADPTNQLKNYPEIVSLFVEKFAELGQKRTPLNYENFKNSFSLDLNTLKTILEFAETDTTEDGSLYLASLISAAMDNDGGSLRLTTANISKDLIGIFRSIYEVDMIESQVREIQTINDSVNSYNIDAISSDLQNVTNSTPNAKLPMTLGGVQIRSAEHLEEILNLNVIRNHLSDDTILRWYDVVYANTMVEIDGYLDEDSSEVKQSIVDRNIRIINELAQNHPNIDLSVLIRSSKLYNNKFFNTPINKRLVDNLFRSIQNANFSRNGFIPTENRNLFVWGPAASKTKALFRIEENGAYTLLAIDKHDEIYDLIKRQ